MDTGAQGSQKGVENDGKYCDSFPAQCPHGCASQRSIQPNDQIHSTTQKNDHKNQRPLNNDEIYFSLFIESEMEYHPIKGKVYEDKCSEDG